MANTNLEALKKKIIGKQNANPSSISLHFCSYIAGRLFPAALFCRTQCPVCELAVPRVGKAFRYRLLLTSCCTCFMSELTNLLKWQENTPEIKFKTFLLLWESPLNSWWRVWWVPDPCTKREWGSYCWDPGRKSSEWVRPLCQLWNCSLGECKRLLMMPYSSTVLFTVMFSLLWMLLFWHNGMNEVVYILILSNFL